MTHKTDIENIRVEVYPDFGFLFPERDPQKQKKLAESVLRQIDRHVDGIDSAQVVWDTRYFCEFCEYDLTDEPWRVNDREAIECCDEQVAAWRERHGESVPEMFPGTRAALDEGSL